MDDAASTHAIGHAVDWWAALLSGSFATSIAVLAVAGLGFAMLRGEVSLRHGIRVVLGCFILFGAPTIAQGLMTTASGHAAGSAQTDPAVIRIPPPPKAQSEANPFDPYAGAAAP
jgi:type IV secretory pathway VirB2 component (pilin)